MQNQPCHIDYLGLQAYASVLSEQEKNFQQLLAEKKGGNVSISPMRIILCQHKPVYTLGKNGDESNLLGMAKTSGAEFHYSSRGGDITYHGPGQLVVYPILDLERLEIGLAKYIELLEESVIRTIAEYGLTGDRSKGASGVWLDVDNPLKIRKICAIGIKSSRWVTMHGIAFNINTDLSYFNYINPCGFTDKGVTSLEVELGEKLDFEHVMWRFVHHFMALFQLQNLDETISTEKRH